jgi:hypothetical protein
VLLTVCIVYVLDYKNVRLLYIHIIDKDYTCVVLEVIWYSEKRCSGVTEGMCLTVEQDSATYAVRVCPGFGAIIIP